MASKTQLSRTNQGQRGLSTSSTGANKGNPMKPKLAANIKIKQSLGGGIKQKGIGSAANKVTAQKKSKGLKQKGTTAKKPAATRVGVNKLNKAPIKAQPKGPKNNSKQANVLHNSVTKSDVVRIRKAHNLATPPMVGGGFKGFIGGK